MGYTEQQILKGRSRQTTNVGVLEMTKEDDMLNELKQIRELLATKPAPPPPLSTGL